MRPRQLSTNLILDTSHPLATAALQTADPDRQLRTYREREMTYQGIHSLRLLVILVLPFSLSLYGLYRIGIDIGLTFGWASKWRCGM